MANLSPTTWITKLNVNGVNTSAEKQGLLDFIKKTILNSMPSVRSFKYKNFECKDIDR